MLRKLYKLAERQIYGQKGSKTARKADKLTEIQRGIHTIRKADMLSERYTYSQKGRHTVRKVDVLSKRHTNLQNNIEGIVPRLPFSSKLFFLLLFAYVSGSLVFLFFFSLRS